MDKKGPFVFITKKFGVLVRLCVPVAIFTAIVLPGGSFLMYGHGIQLTIIKKYPCILANATYDGSRKLTAADVFVHSENEKKEFQSGKTDKNGNFCFYPDQTGRWTVTVDDGMGHRNSGDVILGNDFFEGLPKAVETGLGESRQSATMEEQALTRDDLCRYLLKIVSGILLILVITFIMHYLKKQLENKNKQ